MRRNAVEGRISEPDRLIIGLWAADAAERVLPLFEAAAPGDSRPREAIEGLRAFERGEIRPGELRSRALAAHAAAREVADAAAAAAARAAGTAAATMFMHAPETVGTAEHMLGAAAYAALVREAVAGVPAAGDAEIDWAVRHAPDRVREVLRLVPAFAPGRRRALDVRLAQLDARLRRQENASTRP